MYLSQYVFMLNKILSESESESVSVPIFVPFPVKWAKYSTQPQTDHNKSWANIMHNSWDGLSGLLNAFKLSFTLLFMWCCMLLVNNMAFCLRYCETQYLKVILYTFVFRSKINQSIKVFHHRIIIYYCLHWLMSWGLFLSCDQAAVWKVLSIPMAVHMSLHLAHLFNMSQVSYHHEIAKSHHHWQKWCPCSDKFQRSKVKLTYVKNVPILPFLDCNSNFNSQMSTKLCAKLKVSCCLSRSSVKFQAHMGKKKVFPGISISGL